MSIITISRGTFVGGQRVAELVAQRLGYQCLSREQVLPDAASRFEVPQDELSAALDNRPHFLAGIRLGKIHHICYVRAALCQAVRSDNVVYHGHAEHLFLGGIPHVLAVEVIADSKFRVKAAMDRYGFGREEAINVIKKVDRDRAKWARYIYHVDWRDPSLYDMVVNLQHINIRSAIELIVTAVGKPGVQTTPGSQKIMDDLVLSTEVRARIAQRANVNDGNIEIRANSGVITILGSVDAISEADTIKAIIREIPGVQDIRSKMRIRSPASAISVA